MVAAILKQWVILTILAAVMLAPYTTIGKPLPWLRSWFMYSAPVSPLFASTSFTTEEDVDRERPMLIAYHPHGSFCGAVCGSQGVLHLGLARARVRYGGLARLFRLGWACLVRSTDASQHHLALLPGGMEESALSQRGTARVFVLRRKGFVLGPRAPSLEHPSISSTLTWHTRTGS